MFFSLNFLQRTRRILSALINFAKFREERLVTYNEFTQKTDQLLEEHMELGRVNEQLESTLKDLKVQREADAPQIIALEQENAGMAATINSKNEEQAKLRTEITAAKQRVMEIQDAVQAGANMIRSLHASIAEISSQIVKSPEKLKASISTTTNTIETHHTDIASLRTMQLELTKKFDELEHASLV